MCLAVPGKVKKIYEESGLKMGEIDYSGTVNSVCLEYVPEVVVGQYVIVHAGFAISILNEEEAQKSFEAWDDALDKAREHGFTIENEPLADRNRKREIN
jgi:hydrogenase expression/formation protein HypC